VSINVGLNSQITRTPGNTDADITMAANINSRRLVCFMVATGSMVLNSSTNVKVHTPLPATASDETEVKQ
jgi:hypothetical protein